MFKMWSLRILTCLTVFVLYAGMASGLAWAEFGTLTDCLLGCIPGDNACTECCKEAFSSDMGAECYESYISCAQRCESESGTRAVTCFKECRDNLKSCVDASGDDMREFKCPDWVAPRDCPFECQAWNPRTRKCDGVPRSSCD